MAKRKKPKTQGYRVSRARKAVKMTQEQLADKISMKVDYIRDLEADKIIPGSDVLYRISLELGTTIADLAGLPVRVRENPDDTKLPDRS